MPRRLPLIAACALVATGVSAATLEDPLRPPGRSPAAAPAVAPTGGPLVLTSTMVSAGRRVAIINDRPVQLGERIGPWRLVAIEPGQVRLEGAAGSRTLRLKSARVRAPAAR